MLAGVSPAGINFFAGIKDVVGIENVFGLFKQIINLGAVHLFEIMASDQAVVVFAGHGTVKLKD